MNLSVRFFKRLFIGLLIAMILIPVVLAIVYGCSASKAKKEVALLHEQLQEALSERTITLPEIPTTSFPLAVIPALSEAKQSGLTSGSAIEPTPLPYQTRYPSLYCDAFAPDAWKFYTNTVYLTFNGGISSQTREILDILDQHEVKATFFVIAQGYAQSSSMLKEIVSRGHTLGVQSYTDRYGEIYESVESYLADFNAAYTLIEEVTGVKPEIFRFPGGSINSYNSGIYPQLIAEMTRRGFTYFDWDVVNNDTAPGATGESALEAVLAGIRGKSRAIVLMHDASNKPCTAQSLSSVITTLQGQGYSFAALTPGVEPIQFNYLK